MSKFLKVVAVACLAFLPSLQAEAKVPVVHPGSIAGGAAGNAWMFPTFTMLGELAFIAIATDTAFPLCENPNAGSNAGAGLLAIGKCEYSYPGEKVSYYGSGNVAIVHASIDYPSGNQAHYGSL